jgi:hypothetical protein
MDILGPIPATSISQTHPNGQRRKAAAYATTHRRSMLLLIAVVALQLSAADARRRRSGPSINRRNLRDVAGPPICGGRPNQAYYLLILVINH